MGTRNRQRRAAKAKQRANQQAGRRQSPHGRRSWEDPLTAAERVRIALRGAVAARLRGDARSEADLVEALAAHDQHHVAREAEGELRRLVPDLWVAGWQPAEIVRHARRASSRAGRLVAGAVLADHAPRHPATLHPRWSAQVEELAAAAGTGWPASGWVAEFAHREGLDAHATTVVVLDALAACVELGPLLVILPPPGTASAGAGPDAAPTHGDADSAVLARVRALLAQAESTTYEPEAAAFTAKAQELMARHALDHAIVWDRSGRDDEPVTVRLPIDDPYADAKSLLLQIVAHRSRCQAVYHEHYALSSVVGFASDVASAEILFTSLLVQSQVALRSESAGARAGSRARSRSFRSSFLLAYANRIDERLATVNQEVESQADEARAGSLLPVLAARSAVVDAAVTARFGQLRSAPIRGGTDAVGWARGRLAADRAQLVSGDLDGQSPTSSWSPTANELPLADDACA